MEACSRVEEAAAAGHEGEGDAVVRSRAEEARATPHAAEQRRLSPPPPVTRARAPPPCAGEDGDGGGARVHMVSTSAVPDAKSRRSDALTVRRTPYICLASEENLRAALNKMGVGGYVLEEILDKVKNRHYQLACTLAFEATHGVSCDAGINHPNQYFSESQKVLQAKNHTVQSQSAT